MAGTNTVSGTLSMDDLAATLTRTEQLAFQQVTALAIDPARTRNLVTTISQPNPLGALAIVAKNAASPGGTKILSPTAYISGKQTPVDLYRLPIS